MDAWLSTFDPIARWTAVRLVDGSLQGAVVIGVVWVVCRFVRLSARTRAALWWIASAKLALSLLPLPAMPLRVLPAQEPIQQQGFLHAAAQSSGIEPLASPSVTLEEDRRSGVEGVTPIVRGEPWMELSLVDALLGIWFVIVLAHGVALGVWSRRVRRLVAAAWPVSGEEASEVSALAARLDVRRVPRVMVSDEITSPQAVGAWHPSILMPVDFARRVTRDEWRMAVCHELMHVRRRDLLWGWVPTVAERLFFFHPLARLASDRYLIAREAACDAAVLRALDVDAYEYGRMLVRLGVSRPVPGFAASAGSASLSLLRRRLEMLHQVSATGTTRARWLLAAAVIALVPFQLAAQAPQPADPAARVAAYAQNGSADRQERITPVAVAAAQRSDVSADALARQRELQAAVEAARKAAVAAAQEAAAVAQKQRETVDQQHLDGEVQLLAMRMRQLAAQARLNAQALSQQGAAAADRTGVDGQRQVELTELMRQLAEKLKARQGDTSTLERDMASLNELLQALRTTSAARPTSQATTQFLDEQIAVAKARLAELEAKRSEAQRAAAGSSATAPEQGTAQRLAEAQAAIASSEQRLEGLRRQVLEAERRVADERQKLLVLRQQLEQQKAR